jgi:hypothetical protein
MTKHDHELQPNLAAPDRQVLHISELLPGEVRYADPLCLDVGVIWDQETEVVALPYDTPDRVVQTTFALSSRPEGQQQLRLEGLGEMHVRASMSAAGLAQLQAAAPLSGSDDFADRARRRANAAKMIFDVGPVDLPVWHRETIAGPRSNAPRGVE